MTKVENKPLFVSDELPHYKDAILNYFGQKEELKKTGKRGRPRKPKKIIDTEIDYAIVHKTRENGKVIKVEKRVVFGDIDRVEKRLENSVSNTINTSYIERSNGTLRQHDSHLQRKTLKFAKARNYLTAKSAITICYYNFVKPHWSLSKNEDKSYTPRTPALVAGIIDKLWPIKYLFKMPFQ
jgi:hypothetical protein